MISFDSTARTFDETCWTMDGKNGCVPIHQGGGSVGSHSGESYFNQAPSVREDKKLSFLQQARQEDEEMLMLFKSIIEIIR